MIQVSVFPPASPQGSTVDALPVIDGGLPMGMNPGSSEVIMPSTSESIAPSAHGAL